MPRADPTVGWRRARSRRHPCPRRSQYQVVASGPPRYRLRRKRTRMPRNPWLAIDAATPPLTHNRELHSAWERFLAAGELASVRAPIGASWERSQAAGVDPFSDRPAPVLGAADDVAARWQVHPLAAAVPLIRECLGAVAEESQHLLVVSDDHGMLLWIEGDPRVRLDAADAMNFAEGASWSEANAGTNAIGTGLVARHAVQVFASEHFNAVVQAWTCAAAPVHDPDSGELLGTIDLTGRATTAHPLSFASALATARAVEAQLRYALQERDVRLRSRYDHLVACGGRNALVSTTGRILSGRPEGWLTSERISIPAGGGEVILPSGGRAFAEPVGHADGYIVRAAEVSHAKPRAVVKLRLLGQDRPIIELDGRAVRLSRRHAEILALLTLRPAGMTSEELAADLYGDAGQPVAARVEVSRLRKVLGGGIDTESYRLAIDIASDVARVCGLLDRGEVRAAVEAYGAPMLPRSEAPGIARERAALDAWVRHAAMTCGDVDALWAWVQSASGRDDLPAWKSLLAELEFLDPRRALAAAQVHSLRAVIAYA